MKHFVKKIRFSKGQDAHQSIMRKLATNFIRDGKIQTTLTKAKALKSMMDRLTLKAITKRESDKNVLLKHLGDPKVVSHMMNIVGPVFGERRSGFVTMIRVGIRQGDAAEVARIEWTEKVEKHVKPVKVKVKTVVPAKKTDK